MVRSDDSSVARYLVSPVLGRYHELATVKPGMSLQSVEVQPPVLKPHIAKLAVVVDSCLEVLENGWIDQPTRGRSHDLEIELGEQPCLVANK